MARPSAAALAVVRSDSPASPYPPPDDLSEQEQALWRDVVATKPADWFDDDSAPLLKEYVRAVTVCDLLDARVKEAMAEGEPVDDVKRLLDMRDKEARRMVTMATKLRLTQQSRYTEKSAATANRKAGGKRPWQS